TWVGRDRIGDRAGTRIVDRRRDNHPRHRTCHRPSARAPNPPHCNTTRTARFVVKRVKRTNRVAASGKWECEVMRRAWQCAEIVGERIAKSESIDTPVDRHRAEYLIIDLGIVIGAEKRDDLDRANNARSAKLV